jgi:hypothetical protein
VYLLPPLDFWPTLPYFKERGFPVFCIFPNEQIRNTQMTSTAEYALLTTPYWSDFKETLSVQPMESALSSASCAHSQGFAYILSC